MASLRDFVADVLDAHGAEVDPVEPDGLDVLAPEPLRTVFGWQEFTRLGFGAAQPAGALPIGLEGDWLERFGALLDNRGRFAERQLSLAEPVSPPGDPTAMINHALELPNAVWRLQDEAAAVTRLLLLTFRYTATSDEKRDGLITLGFNCATGSSLGPDLLGRLQAALERQDAWTAPQASALRSAPTLWNAETIAARTRPLLDYRVRNDLEPFIAAMSRRLDRDRCRIHAYHDDLHRAAQLKLAAARRSTGDKAETTVKRDSARIAAIERDYTAKLVDLSHNYALKVTVEWQQGLVVLAPVHRYQLLIKRRKTERVLPIDWHPAARLLEAPLSDWGLGLSPTRTACDDYLHLTDPAGAAPCSYCGKAYCRACHPVACPRCRRTCKWVMSNEASVPSSAPPMRPQMPRVS